MKNLKHLAFLLLLIIFSSINAQVSTSSATLPRENHIPGLLFSIRGGYDFPTYNNNTPYIDYKGGLELGASLDYYWDWIGLGVDYDYIRNKPKNIYPTSNVFIDQVPVTNYKLSEEKITRMFYGIGPSFKYQRSNKAFWEFKLRAGISSIKGGRTELIGSASPVGPPIVALLNFHSGYDVSNNFAGKASIQYNHYLSPNFGFHLGAYYLQHFNVLEKVDPTYRFSSFYHDYTDSDGKYFAYSKEGIHVREKAEKGNIHSVGIYGGLFFTFGGKKVKTGCETCCPVCGKEHQPFCCATCGCDVTITARDTFTKEVLDNTDVILVDQYGSISQSGTTNAYGTVVFKNVKPGNYTVKGKLHTVDLAQSNITNEDFSSCKKNGQPIQKDILYTDENFIIKGKAVVCNTMSGISGASIVLKNNNLGVQKSTMTNDKGEFIFQALQNANYSIFGKKANYLSQTEIVSTKDYDRNKTLFIKLEMCMDPLDCGKAIVLKNILYDLNDYRIRPDAKPELNRLVQFMNDNPSVKVELSSHTDSRATNAYNLTLSQNRANAAVDYIVSQGISRSRLVGIGYGENRLLNRCADNVPCSEEEHQINRRTEVKVVCNN